LLCDRGGGAVDYNAVYDTRTSSTTTTLRHEWLEGGKGARRRRTRGILTKREKVILLLYYSPCGHHQPVSVLAETGSVFFFTPRSKQ